VSVSTSQGPSTVSTPIMFQDYVALWCDSDALSRGRFMINVVGDYKFSENSETHIMLGCAHM